jgi:hypothetical protein
MLRTVSLPGVIGARNYSPIAGPQIRARVRAAASPLSFSGSEEHVPQLGLIRDISPFGLSLAVAEPSAKLTDRLHLSFRFATDGTDVNIDRFAIVRDVQEVDTQGVNGAHGLEFEKLEPSQRIALKSFIAEQA